MRLLGISDWVWFTAAGIAAACLIAEAVRVLSS